MLRSTMPDPFRSPVVGGNILSWSPYLRLAHDYHIPVLQRLYAKDLLGDHALHYFFSGAGEYRIGGKSYAIVPGAVFLCRPGEGYDFRLAEKADVRMLNLHFDVNEIPASRCLYPCPDDDARLKEVLPPELPACQQLSNYPAYEQTFFRLLDAAGRQGLAAHLQRKGLLLEILALLFSNLGAGRKSATLRSHQDAIDKAIQYIHAHPAAHLTLETMADAAGVSRALFCRIFRQTIGLTPQKYLVRHRIELSVAELLYSSTPVKDVAERCGFANVHHFSRIFKNLTGSSPASLRERHNLDE